jgi:hypothetical protein
MTIEELESRIKDLEKASTRRFLLQYLIYPLILAAMGYYFNHQIETAKLETQRIQIAQALLPSLFQGNHSQALATEKMIARVVSKDLADDLNSITEDYYTSKLNIELKAGNMDAAANILTAAQSVGGTISEKLTKTVESDPHSKSIKNYQLASAQERAAFDALLDGRFDEAVKGFQDTENTVNGYHQAYEIHRYLIQHRKDLDNPEIRKQIFKTIAEQYYRGAPADVLQRLRESI